MSASAKTKATLPRLMARNHRDIMVERKPDDAPAGRLTGCITPVDAESDVLTDVMDDPAAISKDLRSRIGKPGWFASA